MGQRQNKELTASTNSLLLKDCPQRWLATFYPTTAAHDNQCLTDQRKPLMRRQGPVQQMARWLTTRIINYNLLLVPRYSAEMLPQWKMSASDKWPSATADEVPFRSSGQCWIYSKAALLLSCLLSSICKLARHLKSPAPLAITAVIITAGKDMAFPL